MNTIDISSLCRENRSSEKRDLEELERFLAQAQKSLNALPKPESAQHHVASTQATLRLSDGDHTETIDQPQLSQTEMLEQLTRSISSSLANQITQEEAPPTRPKYDFRGQHEGKITKMKKR